MDPEKNRTHEKELTPAKKGIYPGSWLLFWLVIKPISLLPYIILYRVSDLFFVVLWYIIPYRKKVVLANLARVFPEKTEAERRTIARKFYRHFADLVVESLRNFSISRSDANRRMVQHNTELLNNYAAQGRSIVICGGHCGNWELWAMAAPLQLNHVLLGIYKRLSNPFFDQKMRESRSRYGIVLVPTIETGNYLRTHPDEVNALILAIDQSPANPQKALWINWFGQDTAVYFGAEKYATDFDRPIVFGSIRKVKRGYYELTYSLVTDTPKAHPKEYITRKLFDILEADIRRDPELWLWTHKRWKHKRPVAAPSEKPSPE